MENKIKNTKQRTLFNCSKFLKFFHEFGFIDKIINIEKISYN